eukprot:TRINITY_DN155_c0_g1_i1.p1 TRINITY_DN155_c0_g1~~TRINITY_DN155_c0_g1_i1.p1  ORF type:complete len:102 (-),score=5.45 TRINITY_DN155_c0_g1_i1:293-598(-)
MRSLQPLRVNICFRLSPTRAPPPPTPSHPSPRSFSSHFERDSLFDDRDDYYQPRDRPDYDKFGDEFDKDILVKEDHKTYSEKAPPSEDEIFKVGSPRIIRY